jgi:hypothetical protein
MGIVADVFETVLLDTNGLKFGSTSLTESSIDVSVQENDVRYGRGNQLAGILHSDRDITLNFTEGEFKYEWLAMQLGQDITTGAKTAYAMPKWYECVTKASTGIGFILDHKPLATGSGLKIFNSSGTEVVVTTGYTISGDDVTIVGGVVGDRYEVRTYKYTTSASTQEIEIDNSVFGSGVQVVMETLEIDPDTEEEPWQPFNIFLKNVYLLVNLQSILLSDRKAQTNAFSLRVVKPSNSTVVGKMLRIPVA